MANTWAEEFTKFQYRNPKAAAKLVSAMWEAVAEMDEPFMAYCLTSLHTAYALAYSLDSNGIPLTYKETTE